jgi:hypothetical protein
MEQQDVNAKRIAQIEEVIRTKSWGGCGCKCHENRIRASLKDAKAKLHGGFFHLHEDCHCCMPSFGLFNFKDK